MDKLTELKAQAYDALAAIEFWQKKLAEINSEIQKQVNENNSTSANLEERPN